MMKIPLKNYRINNYDDWLYHIFNKRKKGINDVLKYYVNSYKNRKIDLLKKDILDFKKSFQRLVRKQFN